MKRKKHKKENMVPILLLVGISTVRLRILTVGIIDCNSLCGDHSLCIRLTHQTLVVLLGGDHSQALEHAQCDFLKIERVKVQSACSGVKALLAQVGAEFDCPLLESFI